jgi:hypothetical protein
MLTLHLDGMMLRSDVILALAAQDYSLFLVFGLILVFRSRLPLGTLVRFLEATVLVEK